MTKLNHDIWMKPSIYKAGYPTGTKRSLSDVTTFICHSAEGWRGAIMGIQNDPLRRASWVETVLVDGTRWGHYEVEDATWTSGSQEWNIKGYAVEFEGRAPDEITDEQVLAAADIYRELRAVCPNLGEPVLEQGFNEHRIVTNGATSCPSDRIRWDDIAAAIAEEDEEDMPLTNEDKAAIRQLCMEAIDKFVRGDVDEDTQRLARQASVQEAIDKLDSAPTLNLSEDDLDRIADKVSLSLATAVVDELADRLQDLD